MSLLGPSEVVQEVAVVLHVCVFKNAAVIAGIRVFSKVVEPVHFIAYSLLAWNVLVEDFIEELVAHI